MDREQYRKLSYDVWERVAGGWGREREMIWEGSRVVGEDLLAKLDPKPGETIVELAAGTGDTGFMAAAAIGDEGRLISSDFAPAMVREARAVSQELGLTNVEHCVIDAEQMDLADASVDGVLCRWGYMLMADPEAAFAETHRVLREGGRVAFSVWAEPERNPWGSIPAKVMVQLGHIPAPQPGDPGIFSLADPERIRSLVTGAGFDEPEITEIEMRWPIEDLGAFHRFITELAGPIKITLDRLSEVERAAAWDEMEARVMPLLARGEGLGGVCHNVLARA